MSSKFEIQALPLAGAYRVSRQPIADSRGLFERLYCAEELQALIGKPLAQINRSLSTRAGTLRGMHFQYQPRAEVKLVSCLRGAIFDVIVDIRAGSPTYLQWHGEVLSEQNHVGIIVPQGFAHGFQTLVDDAETLYFVDEFFDPAHYAGLNPLDPELAIDWPLPVSEISERDRTYPLLPDFQAVCL